MGSKTFKYYKSAQLLGDRATYKGNGVVKRLSPIQYSPYTNGLSNETKNNTYIVISFQTIVYKYIINLFSKQTIIHKKLY